MFIILFVSDEKSSFLKEIVSQINTFIKRQFNDEPKIKILNTFVFPFSNKMFAIKVGIHKMLF